MNPLAQKALEIAAPLVGTFEVPPGSNRGPMVERMQRYGGGLPGYAWCKYFVVWCTGHACESLTLPIFFPRTGDCDVWVAWAKKRDCFYSDPKPGDVFECMRSANDSTHTGFVVDVLKNGRLKTYEGNSNDGGSREGIGVFERERPNRGLRFVRYWEEVDLTDASAPSVRSFSAGTQGTPTQTVTLIAASTSFQEVTAELFLNDKKIMAVPVHAGVTLAPVREVAKRLGFTAKEIAWNREDQTVSIAGRSVPAMHTLLGGIAYAPVRKVADFFGLAVAYDKPSKKVTLYRPTGPVP